MFVSHVKTRTDGGLELTDIELVEPKGGIVFPKKGHYAIEGTYNNTLPIALDSMISTGLFFDDTDFKRPDWALPNFKVDDCGVGVCKVKHRPAAAVASANIASPTATASAPSPTAFPVFNAAKDGPLLQKAVRAEIVTNLGKIHVLLDPKWAPQTATQMYRLFKNKAYDGTRICRLEPGFVMQIAYAQDKQSSYPQMSPAQSALLRNMPEETQDNLRMPNPVKHQKYCLSLARDEKIPSSGSSSFSILLGPAPHLDGKYTVFGKVVDDPESIKTIERIGRQWNPAGKPAVITSTRVQ